MATHSSFLAWITPRTEEPNGLWSMRLQRVSHDCSDLAAAYLGWVLCQSHIAFLCFLGLKVLNIKKIRPDQIYGTCLP